MYRAPACNLVLYDSDFRDFMSSEDPRASRSSPAMALTGTSLTLPQEAVEAQQLFCQEQLFPALAELSQLPEWANWREKLSRVTYPEDVVKEVLQQAEQWKAKRQQVHAERMARGEHDRPSKRHEERKRREERPFKRREKARQS